MISTTALSFSGEETLISWILAGRAVSVGLLPVVLVAQLPKTQAPMNIHMVKKDIDLFFTLRSLCMVISLTPFNLNCLSLALTNIRSSFVLLAIPERAVSF
jgi:hypothetical protein